MNTPFNIDLSQTNISPYLHARKTNRVRFDFGCVNEYIFNFIISLFKEDESFHIFYLDSYSINGLSRETLNLKLKSYIDTFKNKHDFKLKKVSYTEEDDSIEYIFAEIKNVSPEAIRYYYQYMKSLDAEDNYLYFYNKNFIVYITTDVLDVVSSDKEFIKRIKHSIISYDKYYE